MSPAQYDDAPKPLWMEIIEYIVGIAAIIALVYYGSGVGLKIIADKIPAQFEHRMVQMIDYEQFPTSFYYINAEVKMQPLIDTMAATIPGAQGAYTIRIIDDPQVNYLVLPGKYIIMSSGLMKNLTSENELIFILGNALGHFYNRSYLVGLGRGSLWSFVVASVFGPKSNVTSFLTSNVVLTKPKFTVKQEIAADEIALKVVKVKYGHASGIVEFLQRLDHNRADPKYQSFLTTHPIGAERLDDLRSVILEFGYKQDGPVPLDPVFINKFGS